MEQKDKTEQKEKKGRSYRILVVSDTHGENRRILRALEKEAPVDVIIHCGDADGEPERLLEKAGVRTGTVCSHVSAAADAAGASGASGETDAAGSPATTAAADAAGASDASGETDAAGVPGTTAAADAAGASDASGETDAAGVPGVSGPVFYRVRGNCDADPELPAELLLELAGHRLLVLHGHRHDVRYSRERLLKAAEKYGADLVLFGHTHVPEVTPLPERRVLLVNPGSLTFPRQPSRILTYAVLTLEKEKAPRADLRAL